MESLPQTIRGKPLIASWEVKNKKGKTVGRTARYQKGKEKKEFCQFFKRNGNGFLPGGPTEPAPLFGEHILAKSPKSGIVNKV